MRRLALPALLLVLLVLGHGPSAAEEETEDAYPIPVLIGERDKGLDRIWRGIAKGLEQANLDRARPEHLDTEEGAEAVIARIEAEAPPLVFVVGREAARQVGMRLATIPRIFVDTAWNVNGEEFPPAPEPIGPVRVVRQVTFGLKIANVLEALWGRRPRGLLSWVDPEGAVLEQAKAVGPAAGYENAKGEGDADVLLHVRLGAGETLPAIDDLARRATEKGLPLLSDDVAHWGRGAAVLFVPNHVLLGRIAAEQGRLLLVQEAERPPSDEKLPFDPRRAVRVDVGVLEVWVDVAAARRQGLDPPLPWLASVDRLRDSPRRTTGRASR